MIDGVLSADTKDEIEAHLDPHIKRDSVLCSDGAWVYVGVAEKTKCDHQRLTFWRNSTSNFASL